MITVSAAALTMLGATPAASQQAFRACYVPQVGAMYLLDLPGLPTECLSTEHEQISWTEGGAVGSVGSDDLEDGAVTTPKIGSAAVTASNIAPGAVTAAALSEGSVTSVALADSTVGPSHMRAGSVLESHLGTESVGSDQIQFGAVGAADLAIGAVQGYHISAGAVDEGAIAQGAVTGDRLAIQFQRIEDLDLPILSGSSITPSLTCPAGFIALVGGWFSTATGLRAHGSTPATSTAVPTRWVFRFRNDGSGLAEVSIYVVCADLGTA